MQLALATASAEGSMCIHSGAGGNAVALLERGRSFSSPSISSDNEVFGDVFLIMIKICD